MHLFSQTKYEYHHSLLLLPGISAGTKKKRAPTSPTQIFSLKIEQIKVLACGKLHFTESSFFFSLFHMTSQPQSFFFLSLSLFQDYISLCLIISFQLHTMKDYDAAAARTAGSVPSKIFLLMLLTCTSVYASA